ncbi:MAG: hypothetical protein JWO02_1294 [Solirubrobacterales bacterium]|nr:hypothetical protein [Solirubrobacterales bacterium]
MTVFLLVGYIPLALLVVALGIYSSGLRRDSEAARTLGDQLGRRTGSERRTTSPLPYVGTDRRSGAERRAAAAVRTDRAA